MTSPPRSRESVWGGPRVALGALLALAAALRLVGVEYGLPYGSLLDPHEEHVVPRAWAIAHGGGFDPDPFFDYPSLLLYLLAPAQLWQDEPSYLAARLVVIVIGLAGVAAAWWLGSRAYGTLAGGVAAAATAVATTHVAYSRIAVTDVLLTTLVTLSLALLVSGRIELAGLVAGFAVAAKYPGIVLAVPIVVVAWGRWRRAIAAGALAFVGFAAASPFALVHIGEVFADLDGLQRRARAGWLGFEHDHATPIAFGDRLWESLGPVVVIGAIGLVVALVVRAPADRALAAFALAYYAVLLPLDAHFDRYVLPLVPVLAALAGRFRSLAPVTLLVLVVPLTWSIREDRELAKTDVRVVAQERIVPLLREATVAVDPSLPHPPQVFPLALPAPWRGPDPNRNLARLRARGLDYVAVTGAIADRVLAARDEYPVEARFYDELERQATRVWRIDPGPDLAGPWVALYRLPGS